MTLLERIERRQEELEETRAAVETARAIIRTDGRRNTPADLAARDADAIDLAYYIVTPRGTVAPWVARALAGTLPPKEYGQ